MAPDELGDVPGSAASPRWCLSDGRRGMTLQWFLAKLAVDQLLGMRRNPAQDFFSFLLGGGLFAGGIFLLLNQVMVATPGGMGGMGRWGSSYRHGMRYGYGGGLGIPPIGGLSAGMGLLMIPFGLGVALLFVSAYRKLAWLLVWGSGAALIVGILHSLNMNFIPTTLWALVTMIVMIAAGAGLMFKSLYGDDDHDKGQ